MFRKLGIFIGIVIILLIICGVFLKNRRDPFYDYLKFALPVNLAACDLVYSIFEQSDLFDDNDLFSVSQLIPTPKNIKESADKSTPSGDYPFQYIDYKKLNSKNESLFLVTILFPDGGSMTSFFNAIVDTVYRKYYLLNGVVSGSVYTTRYWLSKNHNRILCYNDMPLFFHRTVVLNNATENVNIFPVFLYDIDYAPALNVNFSKNFTQAVFNLRGDTLDDFSVEKIKETKNGLKIRLLRRNEGNSKLLGYRWIKVDF